MGANLENAVRENAERLKEEFGSAVEILYIDTVKEGLDKYPDLKRFTDMGYSFPITVINGEARLSGDISYKDLKTIVDVIMENYHNLR